MGYLFLALALAAGVTKGYYGKKTSGFVKSTSDSMAVSFVRLLFCVLFGAIFVLLTTGTFSAFRIDATGLMIAAFSGVTSALFIATWLLAVKRGAYMLIDVFLTLGVLVPMILCNIIYDEKIAWLKWVGVAILLVAVYVLCSYSNSIKTKLDWKGFALLIACGLANGLTQFSQKQFNYEMAERATIGGLIVDTGAFNFYTYIFGALTLALCLLIARKFGKEETENGKLPFKEIFKKLALYLVVMAICLFLHSYFTTLAGNYLPSSELYPLQQGLSLALSMGMSAIFFGEKITKKSVCGVALAFVALIVINVLPGVLGM